MFRSLRSRLVLSHVIPALLIIPIMGLAMVRILETRLLLPLVYGSLSKDAVLVAEMTRDRPVFWQNALAAQALVDGMAPYLSGRLSFISLDGRVIAAADAPGDGPMPQVDLPDFTRVAQGQTVALQQGPTAEAFAPVYDLSGQLLGIVRMTTQVATVSEQIYQLRYLLGAVVLLALLAGTALGSYLAFSISRPLERVTRIIRSLAEGERRELVEEARGPEETRLLVETVNNLVERLSSLEKARRQLLANLVHELGRPLGAIRSAIAALLRGADHDARLSADLMKGLDGETARLQRLLNDLAGLHDQVLGGLELDKQPVPAGDWLVGQLPPWEAAAREKGLVWRAEIASDLPTVLMDRDRMGQALGNLLSNAIKFTPAGGAISVTARREGDQLLVDVGDSGPGIPEAERQRIFEPFYRGAHGRRIVQGMGLGLSIARDIAAAHGGEIKLDSQPGEGSRFTLYVPVGTRPTP
jgi:two-component system sensor histidine kinase BaeS